MTMAARLPTNIEKGAQGGYGVIRTQHRAKSGKLQRVLEFDHPMGQWDVGWGIRNLVDYDLAHELFMAHQTVYPFRFKAPARLHHYVAAQSIGTGTGALTTFSIYRTWTAAGTGTSRTYNKPIFALANDEFEEVRINGTPTTAYTINKPTPSSGVHQPVQIVFNVAPANGAVLTADFYYDHAVVFTNERLNQASEKTDEEWERDVGRLRGVIVAEVHENPDL